jgi:hypothetical protein
MEQLILHLLGDYVTQSDWMANNKTKRFLPAFLHAIVYSFPFLLLRPSWVAFAVILVSHFIIDRYRIARFMVWVKNVILSPVFWRYISSREWSGAWGHANTKRNIAEARELLWGNCKDTGYPSQRPAWLAVWLLIAADNSLHIAINYVALRWL